MMSDKGDILRSKAENLQRQGRRREAVEAYRQLLGLRPALADCWYNLGYLLKGEGEFDAALDAYSKALASGVRGPEEVHLNRAVIYSDHLRRDDAAEKELQANFAADCIIQRRAALPGIPGRRRCRRRPDPLSSERLFER